MSEQIEALKLADELERWLLVDAPTRVGVAAELRRLHEVNQELLGCLTLALEMLDVDRFVLRESNTGPDGRIDPHDAEMCDELDVVAERFRAAVARATRENT